MKLTVGTYNDLTYSILIRPLVLNSRLADFRAEVTVADEEGEVLDQFTENGDEDWALLNACIKRVITESEGYS